MESGFSRRIHPQCSLVALITNMLAILTNTVVGLIARQGRTNLAEARREFTYRVERAFSFLLNFHAPTFKQRGSL